MGLFKSKKIITVSSSVYNLAGEEDKRPDFLRMTTLSTVLSNGDLASNLTQSYLGGPGVRLKNFIRWCKTSGYDDKVGVVTDFLTASNNLDNSVISDQLKLIEGKDIKIQSSEIGLVDVEWWVEQWILQNNNKDYNTDWEADLNEETKVVTITWADGSISQFTIDNYDTSKRYLYVGYNTTTGREDGDIVKGTEQSSNTLPDVSGWTVVSDDSVSGSETLTKTTKVDVTYSDSTPPVSTTTTETRSESYSDGSPEYSLNTYLGATVDADGTVIQEKNIFRYVTKKHKVVTLDPVVTTTTENIGNAMKTTTTTVTNQVIQYDVVLRDDTQINVLSRNSLLKIFIYQQNSGNSVLDAMFNTNTGTGEYYPYIPMRLWNNFVDQDHYSDLYPICKKALKKATKGNYDKIKSKVAENKNLGDIDFTYVVFGVSLNVKENACKKYLWEFLTALYTNNIDSLAEYEKWKSEYGDYTTAYSKYLEWLDAQKDPTNPLYGTSAPSYSEPPTIPNKGIHISSSNNGNINYNVSLSWRAMSIGQGTGLAKSDAKKGELWFVQNGSEQFNEIIHNTGDMNTSFSVDNITLFFQETETSWKSITIWGFNYNNLIYGGKSVNISASDALNDSDESGFIIPLHSDIYANMPLTQSTQMSTACCFLVFNCYQVKKIKWYQKGWFKIFIMVVLVIVVVVVSVFTFGAGAVAGAGILGSAASVGAALGAVGTAAIIVGAIANALAAIVISIAITEISKAILGPKLGSLIGAIVSMAVTFGLSAYNAGMSMSEAFASLIQPQNLTLVSSAVIKGIDFYAANQVDKYQSKLSGLDDLYKSKSTDLQKKTWENLGSSPYLDPALIYDATQQYYIEGPSSFFDRTLMVGSDYAAMTNGYVTDMVDLTITTDLKGV